MATSKGTLFLSAKLFAERELPGEAATRCLELLSPEDQELLKSVVAVGWYPLEPIMRFHRVLDREYAAGDLGLCRQIGEFAAAWQLNLFHKLVLRIKTPRWMVDRASSMWGAYHDTGRWEVDEPGEGMLRGRLYDFGCVDEAFCLRERGWFARAVQLTGCTLDSIDEPRCRAHGDAFCEYVATYH